MNRRIGVFNCHHSSKATCTTRKVEALKKCVVRLEEKIDILEHHRVSCDGVIEEKYLKTINFNRETSKEPLAKYSFYILEVSDRNELVSK